MPSENIVVHGAVVEGRTEPIIIAMMEGATSEIADYVRYQVLSRLDQVLQHPTGYYRSNIHKDRTGIVSYNVNDNNVIYGPWLEGVGSRNQTTRFKGYHTFRLVKQEMAGHVKEIIESHAIAAAAKL